MHGIAYRYGFPVVQENFQLNKGVQIQGSPGSETCHGEKDQVSVSTLILRERTMRFSRSALNGYLSK
jgi:hypothetical protein